jgi:hypothetical protein
MNASSAEKVVYRCREGQPLSLVAISEMFNRKKVIYCKVMCTNGTKVMSADILLDMFEYFSKRWTAASIPTVQIPGLDLETLGFITKCFLYGEVAVPKAKCDMFEHFALHLFLRGFQDVPPVSSFVFGSMCVQWKYEPFFGFRLCRKCT